MVIVCRIIYVRLRKLARSSMIFEINLRITPFIHKPNFRSKILEFIVTKYPYSWHFKNVVCLALNITGDMIDFGSDFEILVLF